jgi:anti-sigma B factor antagonist
VEPHLEIAQQQIGDVTVFRLKGRVLVGDSSHQLHDAIRDALGKGARKLLLELVAVSYIDSVGVGELVSSYAAAHRAGGELKLSNLTKRVEALVQLTRLNSIIDTHPDEASALRAFANSSAAAQ